MMLALQAQGPMFKSQNPCTHTCNPSIREWRQEDPYRLLVSQPRLLGEFQNNERMVAHAFNPSTREAEAGGYL